MEVVDASWSDVEWLELVHHSTGGINQHRMLHQHKCRWSTTCRFAGAVVEGQSARPWGRPCAPAHSWCWLAGFPFDLS